MPRLRLTDPGPAAVECRDCGATHRDSVPCPPRNRWLISRELVDLLKPISTRKDNAA